MNVLIFLVFIFFILSILILGKSSFYVISGLFLSIGLFLLFILGLKIGLPIYWIAIFYIVINSLITLVFVNNWNEKTKAALVSVLLFIVIVLIFMIPIVKRLGISGFPPQELEELSALSLDVPISFAELTVTVILIGVSGALIDGSMSIASATSEIFHRKSGNLSFTDLFKSSMNVVRSILNSSVNTLLFAFISSSLALIFWYQDLGTPWFVMINSQAFVSEVAVILLSSISVALILPFSAAVTCRLLIKKQANTD